jgi:acetyl-CoA carboxylase carboxyltransferase component
VDALSGYGQIFYRNSVASGVIPQISAIMGPTAGGAVYSPAMTDYIFMVKNTSYMFITGPEVIKSVTGEEINFEDLGGAMAHNEKSGVAQFACENDEDAINQIKRPASYLPANNMEEPPLVDTGDDPTRTDEKLNTIIPDSPNKSYDMRDVIRSSWTTGSFLSPTILCHQYPDGFCPAQRPHHRHHRQPAHGHGRLPGHQRIGQGHPVHPVLRCLQHPAAHHCRRTRLPARQPAGVGRHHPPRRQTALVLQSEATVPKLLLVTRKDYGGSYLAMCSKDLGADFAFAWPTAEIAVMGAAGAANIIHRKEIKGADDPTAKRAEKIAEYEDLFSNPYCAAERGYIDAVIEPAETRPRLIDALEIMCSKRELRPPKKHGNIPM